MRMTPAPITTTVAGTCTYCGQPLYVNAPTTEFDEPLSHVACAVHARRTGARL